MATPIEPQTDAGWIVSIIVGMQSIGIAVAAIPYMSIAYTSAVGSSTILYLLTVGPFLIVGIAVLGLMMVIPPILAGRATDYIVQRYH
jgi:hypothetical protein